MRVSELKVVIELQQRRKVLVQLHTRLMVLLARLGILSSAEAMRRAKQAIINSFYYRAGKGAWKAIDGKVEAA